MLQPASDEGEVLVVSKAVGAFVLLEELSEILQVNFMKTLDVLTAGTRSLDDWDWLPHDGVYGLPVGYQAETVLENSSGMKQRHGYSHDALQSVLQPPQRGAGRVLDLIKQLVLSKGEDGNQLSSMFESQFDEALPVLNL